MYGIGGKPGGQARGSFNDTLQVVGSQAVARLDRGQEAAVGATGGTALSWSCGGREGGPRPLHCAYFTLPSKAPFISILPSLYSPGLGHYHLWLGRLW